MNNQGAFDLALLHLLNQGHRCVSATGRSLLRSSRAGKSAIGALIPDPLYVSTMEGKTVQQLLAANGPGFDELRQHWSGVTVPLLIELQDLHDRTGECLPSMFRDIVLAGGQRIARLFSVSPRLPKLWSAYHKLHGPRLYPRVTPAAPVVIASPPPRGNSRYAINIGILAGLT